MVPFGIVYLRRFRLSKQKVDDDHRVTRVISGLRAIWLTLVVLAQFITASKQFSSIRVLKNHNGTRNGPDLICENTL